MNSQFFSSQLVNGNLNDKDPIFIFCKESRVESYRSFYGCFYLGPFDKSQSMTIANALRRTLLSELNGWAITNVEIQGVSHEYSALPGVLDPVLDILLNLKEIVLKKNPSYNWKNTIKQPLVGYLQVRGPGVIRAIDLQLPPQLQCVDPEQYIATLSDDGFLNLKVNIYEGKTYIVQTVEKNLNWALSESFQKRVKVARLSLDAVFMPVTKVNYILEDNDYEKDLEFNGTKPDVVSAVSMLRDLEIPKKTQNIVLEIWTNGSIHPREALYLSLKKLWILVARTCTASSPDVLIKGSVMESWKSYPDFLEKYGNSLSRRERDSNPRMRVSA